MTPSPAPREAAAVRDRAGEPNPKLHTMEEVTLRLNLKLTYKLNGADVQELMDNIRAGIEYLDGIGKWTQDTEADLIDQADDISID